MREKILKIEEKGFQVLGGYTYYEGFIITTDKQTILIGIDNEPQCCEDWGYFMTNDDVSEFIGAELIDIKVVDECLSVEKVPEIYEGGAMFINFETTAGTLQFTAYNEHNGYYGHSAVIVSRELNQQFLL